MFTVHATKKLLGRVRRPVMPPVVDPDTGLGNWYANVLFWRPQVALLVNERTLFPVLMPLASAATLLDRFPEALGAVLGRHSTTINVSRCQSEPRWRRSLQDCRIRERKKTSPTSPATGPPRPRPGRERLRNHGKRRDPVSSENPWHYWVLGDSASSAKPAVSIS